MVLAGSRGGLERIRLDETAGPALWGLNAGARVPGIDFRGHSQARPAWPGLSHVEGTADGSTDVAVGPNSQAHPSAGDGSVAQRRVDRVSFSRETAEAMAVMNCPRSTCA